MGFLSGKLRSKPERKLSEPTYETPVARKHYEDKPGPYGPHFQKGPQQEDIYNRRANGERIPRGHPDLHNRANSFHQPREHHAYSDPFETRPKKWTNQMVAEHTKYHAAGDFKDAQTRQYEVDLHIANQLSVRPDRTFNPANGQKIKTGIVAAQALVTRGNLIVQGREGFAHKYPQAYKDERALGTHSGQVEHRRTAARGRREEMDTLEGKYGKWATEAQKQR